MGGFYVSIHFCFFFGLYNVLLFATSTATIEVEGQTLTLNSSSDRPCNWWKSNPLSPLTILIEDNGSSLFIMMNEFRHDLFPESVI